MCLQLLGRPTRHAFCRPRSRLDYACKLAHRIDCLLPSNVAKLLHFAQTDADEFRAAEQRQATRATREYAAFRLAAFCTIFAR